MTEGRLHLCQSSSDLPPPLPKAGETLPLVREQLAAVRNLAAGAARERQFPDERVDHIQTATGEAAMNAIVHGGGGSATVCADGDAVQIWVKDHGTGIQMAHLPRATLERGWSSIDSLGHGFWLMLHSVDRLDLLTGTAGTTLVITVTRQHPQAPGPFAMNSPL